MPQKKETSTNNYKELYAVLAFIISGLLIYFVLFPQNSGIIGAFVSSQTTYLLGNGRFFLPFMFIIMGLSFFKQDYIRWVYKITGSIIYIVSASMFLGLLSNIENTSEYGGALGRLSSYSSKL